KVFNLNTYKFHSLGNYVFSIKQFGTSDSHTTETVCSLTHRSHCIVILIAYL
ncbi:hypothetical protein FA15DRAFT_547545, partial [Coprinopsis marcescibilis]